jgi:thiamine-monophosphate kinase
MRVSDLSEAELIARIQSRLQPPPDWLLVGIGDDAAVVAPARGRLEVLTVDALVEGIHFDRAVMPPDAIGHRALAVNLSDLAAMGATPRLALLSLGLPEGLSCGEFDGIVGGLAALAARHRIHVIGGNLTRSPGPLLVDVTVTGTVKPRCVLTRAGARPGDEVYVTGTLGAAGAGLRMLRETPAPNQHASPACIQRFCYPEPRVRVGELLGRNRAATACMDLSDGLADGVHQIARASGVGIEIDADVLPIEAAARAWYAAAGQDPIVGSVTAGDDYELIFTCRPKGKRRLRAARLREGPVLTRIGVCTSRPGVFLTRAAQGGPLAEPMPIGYSHFLASN